MLWLMRFVSGYILLCVSGTRPGAFVNELVKRGIDVWGIRAEGGEVFCRVHLSDGNAVQSLAKGRSRRVRIIKRYGLPVIIRKNRRRTGLFVGLALFFVIFHVMSLFLWNVEICELDTISRSAAAEKLSSFGIREGVRAEFESLKRMQTSAMLAFGNLSWMTINVDGSFAEINATEKQEPETNDTAPRNIKASRDGQVIRADVYRGMAAVQSGDAVVKGDLLISGIVETEKGGVSLARADGCVLAKTRYEKVFELPGNCSAAVWEGEPQKRRSVRLFGVVIPLTMCVPDESSLVFRTEEQAVFRGTAASASLIEERLYPYSIEEKIRSEQQARDALYKRMLINELLSFRGKAIKSRQTEYSQTDEGYVLTVSYECEEDIAKPARLLSQDFHIIKRQLEN